MAGTGKRADDTKNDISAPSRAALAEVLNELEPPTPKAAPWLKLKLKHSALSYLYCVNRFLRCTRNRESFVIHSLVMVYSKLKGRQNGFITDFFKGFGSSKPNVGIVIPQECVAK